MPPSSAVNIPDVQTLFNVIRGVHVFTAFSCGRSAVLIMAVKSTRNQVRWLNDRRLVKWTVGH